MRGGRVFVCIPDYTPGARDDCPNTVHDYPLPAGYIAASDVADARLRARWSNVKCPACGRYGWRPGRALTGDYADSSPRVPWVGEQQ